MALKRGCLRRFTLVVSLDVATALSCSLVRGSGEVWTREHTWFEGVYESAHVCTTTRGQVHKYEY